MPTALRDLKYLFQWDDFAVGACVGMAAGFYRSAGDSPRTFASVSGDAAGTMWSGGGVDQHRMANVSTDQEMTSSVEQ